MEYDKQQILDSLEGFNREEIRRLHRLCGYSGSTNGQKFNKAEMIQHIRGGVPKFDPKSADNFLAEAHQIIAENRQRGIFFAPIKSLPMKDREL